MCMGGYIPTESQKADPERSGRWWFREKKHGVDCFYLWPGSNDYWANVQHEGEAFMVLKFRFRYDKEDTFANALTNLIAVRFHYCAEII